MKKILIVVIIVLTTFQAQAQRSKERQNALLKSCNFAEIEVFNIIWQKVYEVDMTAPEIRQNIINEMFFSEIVTDNNNLIIGRFEDVEPMWKESDMDNSIFANSLIRAVNISGRLTVEIKDNRYRVTIKDLAVTSSVRDSSYIHHKKLFPLIMDKKGIIRSDYRSTLEIYNYTFEKEFAFSNKRELGENW